MSPTVSEQVEAGSHCPSAGWIWINGASQRDPAVCPVAPSPHPVVVERRPKPHTGAVRAHFAGHGTRQRTRVGAADEATQTGRSRRTSGRRGQAGVELHGNAERWESLGPRSWPSTARPCQCAVRRRHRGSLKPMSAWPPGTCHVPAAGRSTPPTYRKSRVGLQATGVRVIEPVMTASITDSATVVVSSRYSSAPAGVRRRSPVA